jgi:hypothetical protein
MAFMGIIFIYSIRCFSPLPDNIGKACMWVHNQSHAKYHCVDAHESTCVPISQLNKTNEPKLSFPQYVNRTNVRWRWHEPSVCVCEPGYTVHRGHCLETVPTLSDVDLAASVIGTLILCMGILLNELFAQCGFESYPSYERNIVHGFNYFAFFTFIFFMIASVRYGLISSQY